MLEAMEIIVLVLLFCIFSYLWLRIKEKLHSDLINHINTYNRNKNENEENEDEDENNIEIKKNGFILEVALWEIGILSYKLVMMAFIIICILYLIKWVFGFYSHKHDFINETSTNEKNNFFYELHNITHPDKKITFEPVRLFYDVTLLFLMDLKIGTLTTLLSFLITFLYHTKVFSVEESWDVNAMHIHIDILMLILFIIFSIALYTCFLLLVK